MKILVTGANGFIGKNLVRSLLAFHDVRLLVRENSNVDYVNKSHIYRDSKDIKALINYFSEEKFEGIIHLATCFKVQHNSNDLTSMLSSNIELGSRLLEASINTSKPWFINIGSTWQNYYDDSYCPVNLYAATKQAFEDIAEYYIDAYDLKFVTLKISDTYGPNDSRKKILNLLVSLDENSSINMSPGEQFLNLIYIDDVISAIKLLIKLVKIEELCERDYYIRSNETLRLKDIVIKLEKVIGRRIKILWGPCYRNREVMTPVFSGIPLPGWSPIYSLDEGLKKMISN
jgi:CDP-paratose synthetase